MCFDWLVSGQIPPTKPAASVRGPRHVVKKGKIPVLSPEDARRLLDSIDTSRIAGLRDRALFGIMVYSFARVGAVIRLRVEDCYQNGKPWSIWLQEKAAKFHEVPAHHDAQAYLDACIGPAGIGEEKGFALFRTIAGRNGPLTPRAMTRHGVVRLIERRWRAAGLNHRIRRHTFRSAFADFMGCRGWFRLGSWGGRIAVDSARVAQQGYGCV